MRPWKEQETRDVRSNTLNKDVTRGREVRTYPLEVVDDISRVTASKMWHRHADLFVVIIKVDADILLQFLPSPQGSVNRVLKDDPAVEQAVLWDLLLGRGRAELAYYAFGCTVCLTSRLMCIRRMVHLTNLRYTVVAVDVHRGQHQSCQENHQAEDEAAQAQRKRLFRPQDRNHPPL